MYARLHLSKTTGFFFFLFFFILFHPHQKNPGADIYDTAIINCENNATITLNGVGVLPGNSHPAEEEEEEDGEKEGKEGKGEPKVIDVKIFGEKGCLFYGGNDGCHQSGLCYVILFCLLVLNRTI